jgi:hypothetical protein
VSEQLGTAVLRLEVDLQPLRDGLRQARQLIGNLNGSIGVGAGGTGGGSSGGRSRSGGARESTRALEIAQEKRFRLARRIDALEERGANVSRLRARLGELTEAQTRRQFGTFRQLNSQLARQVVLEERRQQAVERTARAARQQAAIGARQGGARESIFADERAKDRRFRIAQRIERLEERGVDVSRLRTRLGELTTSYTQRQYGTARQLSRELERQVTLTEARGRREAQYQRTLARSARVGGPRSPIGGSAQLPGSPAFLRNQAQIGGARSPIRGSVNLPGSPAFIEAQAAEYQRAITQAGRAGGARSPIRGSINTPGSPAFIEAQAAEYQRAITQAGRAGGARSSVRGSVNTPGSPAFIQAQALEYQRGIDRAARAGGSSSPIRGSINIPGSPAFIEAQAQEYDRAATKAARSGGARNSIRGDVSIPGSPAYIEAQADAYRRALDRAARVGGPSLPVSGRLINGGVVPGSPADLQSRGQTAAAGRVSGPVSPINGRLVNGAAIPGSPAALRDAAQAELRLTRERERAAKATERAAESERQRLRGRIGEAIGSGIIGGAFPALFGQGAGASAGGLLGGIAGGLFGSGGGFAGSLLGTSIGAQVDKLGSLSQALENPVARFQELKDAALLSSRSLEKTIEKLISAGRYAEAEALIREDVSKRGLDAASANKVAEESDALKRSFADLGLQLAQVAQGPLTDFLNLLNNALKPGSVAARVRAVREDLSPQDRAGFDARREELKRQGGQNILDINLQVLSEYDDRTASARKNAEAIVEARKQDGKYLQLNYRLISAQAQGNERAALETQLQLVKEDARRTATLDPTKALEAERKAKQDTYQLTEQLRQLEQKRWAESIVSANKLAAIQDQIAITTRSLNLTESGVKVIQAEARIRDAIRTEQNAQAALRATPSDTGLQNAAREAAEATRQAAADARNQLIIGFREARREAEEAAAALTGAYTRLLSLRTGNDGLNKYLNASDRRLREEQTYRSLLPLFNQAKGDARGLLRPAGITGFDVNFSGRTADVNQQILSFINTVEQEKEAQRGLGIANENAIRANNSLLQATTSLTANSISLNETLVQAIPALTALATKDWSVFVNVPGGTASGDVLQAVNSKS